MILQSFLKKLGGRVTEARKTRALLQREAADGSGISYRYYQDIEAGKANITIATLVQLAKFFCIHPCDLLPSKTEL